MLKGVSVVTHFKTQNAHLAFHALTEICGSYVQKIAAPNVLSGETVRGFQTWQKVFELNIIHLLSDTLLS